MIRGGGLVGQAREHLPARLRALVEHAAALDAAAPRQRLQRRAEQDVFVPSVPGP